MRQLSARDQLVDAPQRRAKIRASAAIQLQMVQIPLKFFEICHQGILLHLAVALQDVQPEAVEKQPLTQQDIMDRAQKPAGQPARAGRRRVNHNRKLPELPPSEYSSGSISATPL